MQLKNTESILFEHSSCVTKFDKKIKLVPGKLLYSVVNSVFQINNVNLRKCYFFQIFVHVWIFFIQTLVSIRFSEI